MAERWKEVAGFDGYSVSSFGRVRGPRSMLKPGLVSGYPYVSLHRDGKQVGKFVHQLVLESFRGQRPHGTQSRHTPDRTKTNNRLNNLRWGTVKENHADAIRDGTHTGLRNVGERHPYATITNRKARRIKRMIARGGRSPDIARLCGVKLHTVKNIKFGLAFREA